eukprot:jgi/Tetstr1/445750/TSEL_033398.t1
MAPGRCTPAAGYLAGCLAFLEEHGVRLGVDYPLPLSEEDIPFGRMKQMERIDAGGSGLLPSSTLSPGKACVAAKFLTALVL